MSLEIILPRHRAESEGIESCEQWYTHRTWYSFTLRNSVFESYGLCIHERHVEFDHHDRCT